MISLAMYMMVECGMNSRRNKKSKIRNKIERKFRKRKENKNIDLLKGDEEIDLFTQKL